ncbi:PD-(D/E)XK nuclease family protein [Psychroserpens damuponensis]|uniref:PD-(D/E)XK nuclease family protein n=1 Tax=Psychroserpens damuponensis TaxID=943936 RepID=UPI00058C00CF|nr:PD-(D/E)XK nuclease family protein [Psychroserpens damuponensis]
MRTFIDDVITDLLDKGDDISQLTFVLPSKRAGTFLKQAISSHVKKTIFSPQIVSIEEFVETLSNFQYATNAELLFEFYEVYLTHTPKEHIEPFDKFSKWAQILLQDFNELDRYLIEKNKIFDYLAAIKEIENHHWSLDEEPTQYIKNYLQFWNRLKTYYTAFQNQLRAKKKGYQGLIYKEAVNNIEHYISISPNKKFVFVGFNALNKAEELIIQQLLEQELATIYWDIDDAFITNPIHDAGLFTRAHKRTWPYFNTHDFNWIQNHYSEEKDIEIIGAPKNISQIKYVGELLETIYNQKQTLQNVAVILGDETLLIPLLNSIPKAIKAINITMGLPLKAIPLASLFESLFNIHKTTSRQLYYKDIINLLSNPFVNPLFEHETSNSAETLINHIQFNNKVYLTVGEIKEIINTHHELIDILFDNWEDQPKKALKNCSKLIYYIKSNLEDDKTSNRLPLEYLFRFNQVFNSLDTLNTSFTHINSIATLFSLYRELIKSETLDFKGEPLKGLQIMGMLESRVLDFETVIITSVNEGILPAGKSNNSFIPFDVKIENQLPTYKEKDAVYTYHFYRLLQRAKTAYILYNTEPDVLNGGEKSRFITQLEIEKKHPIKHHIVSAQVPSLENRLQQVKKTPKVIATLNKVAAKGFSPSSLTNYMRNPIDFYYEKVLGIKRYEEVEESVAFNTLGTVIHNTLEDFYKPLVGHSLKTNDIKTMRSKIDDTVTHHFKQEFKEGDIASGKNLIIYEISKRYISNFLDIELNTIKEGNTIKIIAIETKNDVPIYIESLSKTVNLTGKVDRVDEYNGTLRIIDYKTGKVAPGQVNIIDWEDITTDYDKYSKSFQILMYAYMMYKDNKINLPVEAGIISFKSLNLGLLKFATKPSLNSKTKDYSITSETLDAFEIELKKLISEIFNETINFIEKEV